MKKTNKRGYTAKKSKAHIRKLHRARIGLFSVLLLALIIVRGDAGPIQASPQPKSSGSVLAYATSMSRAELLNATNAFRAQNGLAPLALNAQLNNSAQSKAQHMVNNNYWAHNAPDGTTPWYFFDAAGYNYIRAGENLAYGFATSQDTVNGWIASPGHRANILGDYQDVGFGFVDGATYQSGPNTVVVAHYGALSTPSPAPVASTPTPVAQATPPPPSSTLAAPPAPSTSTTPTQPETEQPAQKPDAPTEPKSPKPTKPADVPEVTVASTASVSLLDQLTVGKPRLAAIISLMLVLSVVAGFVLTHRSFVRHAALVGERYALTHPLVDTTVIAATIVLVLSTSVGRIG
jgi:hypothetical protein